MPAAYPRDATIAVVGDGFGSLLVYATAVYLGFGRDEVTVHGTSANPVGTYEGFANNLGQTVLRSESEGHFLPADWPTFAQLNAWSHRSPGPLARSIRRRYNPGVAEILTEAHVVGRELGWEQARVPHRVGWLQRAEGPPAHFVLYDEEARYLGRARHVVLALGHGPLAFPPALDAARRDPGAPRRPRRGRARRARPAAGPSHRRGPPSRPEHGGGANGAWGGALGGGGPGGGWTGGGAGGACVPGGAADACSPVTGGGAAPSGSAEPPAAVTAGPPPCSVAGGAAAPLPGQGTGPLCSVGGGTGASVPRTSSTDSPTSMRSPGASAVGPSMRRPLTRVPLVEPRSSMRRPPSVRATMA